MSRQISGGPSVQLNTVDIPSPRLKQGRYAAPPLLVRSSKGGEERPGYVVLRRPFAAVMILNVRCRFLPSQNFLFVYIACWARNARQLFLLSVVRRFLLLRTYFTATSTSRDVFSSTIWYTTLGGSIRTICTSISRPSGPCIHAQSGTE